MPITHPKVKDEDIISDYLSGMSFRQLAKKYGMGTKSIRYRLDRNNIERREGSVSKLTICDVCETMFEQPVWGRRRTCNNHCKLILCHLHRKKRFTQTMEYKYPWGSYVYTALKSICDDIIRRKGDKPHIAYSDISDQFRVNFGVRLIDPTLRGTIIEHMASKGYDYEVHKFKKKKC